MATVEVKVVDVSGARTCALEAPDDVPVERILVLLIERMQLPLNSPDGQLMSYKLHHRRTGTQLLETLTLAEGGVASGDELRLQPEITAGREDDPRTPASTRPPEEARPPCRIRQSS